ncbi:helix-turn-helix domain-containing protein [Barnesiella viscericola]|uniref:helix-turn-helix domain-containing protein n=1 Tax=Barnesiella viscericola TaxID=397865 RepID=UPI0023549D56|nr:helix-turn-helix transcriptional regulator [Barnesiella viscericola]
MSIFYEEVHKTCYNYEVSELSVFKYFNLRKNSPPVFSEVDRSMLCMVCEGTIEVQFGRHGTEVVEAGNFFLVPPGVYFYGRQIGQAQVMCGSFSGKPKFCNIYSIENLYHDATASHINPEDSFYTLPIRERLQQFLELLAACINDGIMCIHFHQLKLQELFLLLRMYYTKAELACMFAPIFGADDDFRQFVLKHYKEFVDIKQFSALANMTPSTFQRHFKQTFKKPVNKWFMDLKSEQIIRDIKTSTKSINEISDEYGFSSLQYFSNFCKRQFGKNPTELRAESF